MDEVPAAETPDRVLPFINCYAIACLLQKVLLSGSTLLSHWLSSLVSFNDH